MPLVKSFVEIYKGRIELESRTKDENPADHGTEVHVYLKSA